MEVVYNWNEFSTERRVTISPRTKPDPIKEIAGRIQNLIYKDMVRLAESLGRTPPQLLEWAERELQRKD